MLRYTIKRVLLAILTLWVIITVTFCLMHAIPGDPFSDEKRIQPEIMANLEAKYGLDKPLIEQYFVYMGNLLHGDFGTSFKYANRTVNSLIAQGAPVSFSLGAIACAFGILVGIVFGVISAINRGRFPDYLVIILSILCVSVPAFVFASLFQYAFGAKLQWLPVAGWKGPVYMVLPCLALGLRLIAYVARMMRTSMLDVLGQDYIMTARAKGLTSGQVIRRHTIRNAIMPVVSVAGSMIAGTLVGSFVIENIFNIPGMGKYLVDAVTDNDYTVVLGMTTFYALVLVLLMALLVPVFSSYSMSSQDGSAVNKGPTLAHIFGTDSLGRDLSVRCWEGARVSLFIAFVATFVNLIIGVFYGGISGYAGGRVDLFMMRLVEIVTTVPDLLWVILLMVIMGPGLHTIIIAISITGWGSMARIVRGQILQLKQSEYVMASRTLGGRGRWILLKHLIPNTMGPIIIELTFSIPNAIFTEATLSYLGLGVPVPLSSWGTLANEGSRMLLLYPYQLLFPALLISITMLGFNLLGDGLRDALDPKMRN